VVRSHGRRCAWRCDRWARWADQRVHNVRSTGVRESGPGYMSERNMKGKMLSNCVGFGLGWIENNEKMLKWVLSNESALFDAV
jgi:hypothetical protein